MCRKFAGHQNAYLGAGGASRTTAGQEVRPTTAEFFDPLVESGLADPDFRVREVAIDLLPDTNPSNSPRGLPRHCPTSMVHDPIARPAWSEALAQHDPAFEAWIDAGLPGGDPVLLDVAERRADPRLAKRVAAGWKSLSAELMPQLTAVAVKQCSPLLSRTLFGERETARGTSAVCPLPTISAPTMRGSASVSTIGNRGSQPRRLKSSETGIAITRRRCGRKRPAASRPATAKYAQAHKHGFAFEAHFQSGHGAHRAGYHALQACNPPLG